MLTLRTKPADPNKESHYLAIGLWCRLFWTSGSFIELGCSPRMEFTGFSHMSLNPDDSELDRSYLAQAERHIIQIRVYLARQQQFVDRLALESAPTGAAEKTLEVLVSTLDAFERHRALLLDRLAQYEPAGRYSD